MTALEQGSDPRKSSLELGLEGTVEERSCLYWSGKASGETAIPGGGHRLPRGYSLATAKQPQETPVRERPHSEEPLEPYSHSHFPVSGPINPSTPFFCQSPFDLDFLLAPATKGIPKPQWLS